MAGSFSHCNDKDGSFRFDLIENMGDAYEACEEMHALIHILTGGDRGAIQHALDIYHERVLKGVPDGHRGKSPTQRL